MKTVSADILIKYSSIIVFFVFGILIAAASLIVFPFSNSRATGEMLQIKIKVQGIRQPFDKLNTAIQFYSLAGTKVREETAVFIYKGDNVFTSDVPLNADFNFKQPYALFIKPDKCTGKLFCSTTNMGSTCTVPQFMFYQAVNGIDLTSVMFMAGDVTPVNGKVDAGDMSAIISQLGKNDKTALVADLNNDGIVDITDYGLAFFSLTNNAKDDAITLSATSPSQTPILSPTNGLTPTPTLQPSVTLAPTLTTAPTVTNVPTPTRIPTSTPVPTAKPTQAPTAKPSVGQCFIDNELTLDVGKTSDCECEMGICANVTCTSCPSGTCTCTVPRDYPPQTANCSPSGKIDVRTCKK